MQKQSVSRRLFLKWLAGLVGVPAGIVGYGRYVEPHWVQVEEIVLQMPNLPQHLTGKRIAQISDIHVGRYFTAERLADAIGRVNQLQVDWLMLTGDFVTTGGRERGSGSAARQAAAASFVEPIRQAQMPTFAVMGNHDLWGGVAMIEKYLNETPVTILRNDATEIAAGLWLAGVDDVWSGSPDLRAALRNVPTGSINLLMAHEPDYFDRVLAQKAPIAAQFSGHSHGGQVRLPTLFPDPSGHYSYAPIVPEFSERYPIGLRQIDQRYVYTNRGLGCWPVPYRINCPPEISVFVLQS